MGSAVIGALRVTLGLDSAEFISGMQAAQSRMASMSKAFTADSATVRASAKALGMSVGAMTREIGAIKAMVDPGSVALAGYRQQVRLLEQSMKLGVITQEQFKTGMQGALAAFRQGGAAVVQQSGAMRAGMQQMGFQVSDLAVQIAGGTSAMKAFAMQGPQMVQAISLMSGSTGKFAAFMGGPWGAVLTAGIAILGALGVAYMNSADSAEKATDASKKLADHQLDVANFFDVATGRIKENSRVLIENAKAKIANRMVDIGNEQRQRMKAIPGIVTGSMKRQPTGEYITSMVGGEVVSSPIYGPVNMDLVKAIQGAGRNPDAMAKNLSELARSKSPSAGAAAELSDLLAQQTLSGRERKQLADQLSSLEAGVLAPSLREPGGSRKTGTQRKGDKPEKALSAEIDARFASDIERLNDEELRAKLALATNADDRLALSMDLLKSERDARVREIESNKDFTAAQKAAQIAYIDRLYGKDAETGPDGSLSVQAKPGLFAQAELRKAEEEQARLANDMLQRQAETLNAMADIEPNTKERARLEQEALRLQEQIQNNLIEQQIANGQIADADKARAELAKQQEITRRKLALQQMTPGQRYLYNLNLESQNINEAIDGIKIDGLDRLNDGLVDAVMGVKSLGAVFRDVAKQIVADLLQIAIRQTIVRSLANVLGLAGGGSFGKILGGGGGSSVGSAFAGVRADRGGAFRVIGRPGMDQNLLSLNGSPAAFVSQGEIINIGRGNQGGGGSSVVHVVPSAYFDAVVDGRAARVAAPMAAASGHFARSAAGGDMQRKARRTIPG